MASNSGGQNMSNIDVTAGEFGAYAQKVNNLEANLVQLSSTVNSGFAAINTKLDERGRPQWQVLISACVLIVGILGSLGTLVYVPLRNDVSALSQKLDNISNNFPTKGDVEYRLQAGLQSRLDWQRQSENRDEMLSRNLEKLTDKIVPRGEHEEHWHGVDRDISNLQREIDDTRRQLGDTYSLRDAIQDYSKRINALEHKDMH